MNKKILITVMCFFLIIISSGTISMIEFYYAKSDNKMPLFSLKTENEQYQYIKYSSLLYNVYNCYSGKVFILSKREKAPLCNRIIKYNKEGFYTNIKGYKILKNKYQMIYNISKTFNEIENIESDQELESAIILAEDYERLMHIPIETLYINNEEISIETFKEFVQVNKYGDYEWAFQINDSKYYKCIKNNLYKNYKDGMCYGEWKKFELDEQWCSLAKISLVENIKNTYNKYCK